VVASQDVDAAHGLLAPLDLSNDQVGLTPRCDRPRQVAKPSTPAEPTLVAIHTGVWLSAPTVLVLIARTRVSATPHGEPTIGRSHRHAPPEELVTQTVPAPGGGRGGRRNDEKFELRCSAARASAAACVPFPRFR
jgi:hypothetical protein